MKSIAKRMTVVAVAALTAIAMTGCSGGNSGSDGSGAGPVTLNFKTNLATDSTGLAVFTKITKAFEKENPNISVKLTSDPSNFENDMKVRMASGDLPDLWFTHGWSLLRYSPFLEPLQTQPWAKNFNKALAPAMKNSKGEFFALPVTTDIAGIVYNKTVLADNGIDPASLKSWGEFDAALKKLSAAGVVPISASGKDTWFTGNIPDFMASGAFDKPTLKKFTSGTFDTDAYGTLMQEVSNWSKDGRFNPDYASAPNDDIARGLAEGKTAFVFIQNNLITNAHTFNPDAKLGFMPIPTFDGKPFLVGGEGTAIGVSRTSKHKEQALKYLDYLAQPKNMAAMATDAGAQPGLTNAKSDLGALQASYDEFVTGNKYPLYPYFDRVYLPNGMWDSMITTTASVITRQGTVESAVGQMKTDFNGLFGQDK